MVERLQKILSSAGLMSRRKAEEYIKSGRVSVNGIVADLGSKADIECDVISVDGKAIENGPKDKVYIMLNKPCGYVTTLSDEKGRKCVNDLVKSVGKRVFPVGRLDVNTKGLLILTNDGEFANFLMHPSHNIDKCYKASVIGDRIDNSINILSTDMLIDGYKVKGASVRKLTEEASSATLLITIHEGRNRQVRKMCDKAGLKVVELCRISEGNINLGDLPSGKWRFLTNDELQDVFSLMNSVGRT